MTQSKKNKLICVVPSLVGGGAEKAMLTLIEHFNRDIFEPVLVLFEAKGEYMDLIPDDIRVITLGKKNKFDFISLVNKLRRVLSEERPQVIFSILWYANVITLLAQKTSKSNAPVVVEIQNVMTMFLGGERFPWGKRLLMRKIYPMADSIIILSDTMRKDMVQNFNTPSDLMSIIHNPMDIEKIEQLSAQDPCHPWFKDNIPVVVSVGRLHRQKDFPTLLRAFAESRKKGNYRLIILGEGEKRAELEALIDELGLSDSVDLAGFVKNPYAYIKKSRLFVMSSIHEGLPVAMIEVMACVTPVVACACPSVAEMITDGVNGLLAPVGDYVALSKAMSRVLEDEELGERLADKARNEGQKYSARKIVAEYEEKFTMLSKDR